MKTMDDFVRWLVARLVMMDDSCKADAEVVITPPVATTTLS
jgi:hypothetical protein